MEATGKIKDITRDYNTGKPIISFVLSTKELPSIAELTDCDALDITVKRHREKRSLSANAYFHVLVTKIADVLGATNDEVKNRLIREYGAFEFIGEQIPTLKLKAEYEAEILRREGIHVKPIGYETDERGEWVRLALMRGSHTYDSKEMSRLIDGTVREAKELGIETKTPEEIARMMALWGKE